MIRKIMAVFIFAGCALVPLAAFASGSGPFLRDEAPVYTGPVQEGDLQELTTEDFEDFGIESERPEDQYRRYQKVLALAAPGILVPYKMKIIDQDLALEDFIGFGVSQELAEARYQGYLDTVPATFDGRTIHFVYVYHRPLARAGSEDETSVT